MNKAGNTYVQNNIYLIPTNFPQIYFIRVYTKVCDNEFAVQFTVHLDKFLYENQLDALISQIYFGIKLYIF